MTANDERDQRKSNNPLVTWLVILLLLLPVGYVLSVGPFFWLVKHRYLDNSVGVVYVPLGMLRIHCPPFKAVLDPYTDWWER